MSQFFTPPPLPPPQNIIINDRNIKGLVRTYLIPYRRKRELPPNLQVIGDWDVSEVTNMNELFAGNKNFNEPLNNWNVSKVTEMDEMFSGCAKFNKPLNDWDVGNVTTVGSRS
jgi:surface protein